LTYADRLLPPDILHASSYHDGTGLFGADYSHTISERAGFDIATLRLRDLDSVRAGKGRLLDVGAGYGHFVSAAQANGWNAEGLEVVPAAADRARDMYGVTVHVGDVLSYRPTSRYDVVSFGQTLEHMRDPVEILRHVRKTLLVPGGMLLLELPNVRSVARMLAGAHWMHWQPGDHALYPDARSLRPLLRRAGFEVELIRTDSMVFDWMPTVMVAHNLGLVSRPVLGSGVVWSLQRLPRQDLLAASLRVAGASLDALGVGQDLRVVARAS
jgi:SAM-dependent methyltransferase